MNFIFKLTILADLLREAELYDGTCTKLVSSLWSIPDTTPSLNRASAPQLEMHQFPVQRDSFTGLSCNWIRRRVHSTERHFRCNSHNFSMFYAYVSINNFFVF